MEKEDVHLRTPMLKIWWLLELLEVAPTKAAPSFNGVRVILGATLLKTTLSRTMRHPSLICHGEAAAAAEEVAIVFLQFLGTVVFQTRNSTRIGQKEQEVVEAFIAGVIGKN